MSGRTIAMLGLIGSVCVGSVSAPYADAAVSSRNRGIRFSARPKGESRIVLRWNATRDVRRKASGYDFQIWYDGEWYTFLGTRQPSSGRIPVVAQLPGGNDRFCLRMVALGRSTDEDGEPAIVGSGYAGNEGPCR